MRYVLNAGTIRKLEKQTILEAKMPGMVLMERAAMAAAELVQDTINVNEGPVLAVCGTGNNGADAVAAARILFGKGFSVHICLLGQQSKRSIELEKQIHIAQYAGISFVLWNEINLDEYTILLDGIFGIGLSREITGEYKSIIQQINDSRSNVISIDVPSGIHTDTGEVMGIAVKAAQTITFSYEKTGLLLYPGAEYAGIIKLKDIGLILPSEKKNNFHYFTYQKEDLKLLPLRKKNGNKGTFGKILIIAGSVKMAGACYFSAKAAYRTGAGLVKVLTHEENRVIIQTLLPEALLETYEPELLIQEETVSAIEKACGWAGVIVLGPGIGVTSEAGRLVSIVLKSARVPLVIDADAITLLSRKRELFQSGSSYWRKLCMEQEVILTPHVKEMAVLMEQTVSLVSKNFLQAAMEAAHSNCIIALKDARSAVTDGTDCYINTSGNCGMAKGGSGDVLTGIIAALLAGGLSKMQAAALGVYVHGLAGDAAAEEKGIYSLTASDIIEALSQVLKNQEAF